MAVQIFFSYVHEDQDLLNKLKSHLRSLQQEGLIDMQHDRDISTGVEWNSEIDARLNMAEIILLMISQYSLNSDYSYSIEVQRAIERHERGEARVIPVILRPVYYQRTPFAMLQVLPTDAKPVITWHDLDEAFSDVTKGIRKVIIESFQPSVASDQAIRLDPSLAAQSTSGDAIKNRIFQLSEDFLRKRMKEQVVTFRVLWKTWKELPIDVLAKNHEQIAKTSSGLGLVGSSPILPAISVISWAVVNWPHLSKSNTAPQLRDKIIEEAEARGCSPALSRALALYLQTEIPK